jgi:hypothetical protein
MRPEWRSLCQILVIFRSSFHDPGSGLAGILVAGVGVEFLQYLRVRTGELVRTGFADSAQLGIVKNHE